MDIVMKKSALIPLSIFILLALPPSVSTLADEPIPTPPPPFQLAGEKRTTPLGIPAVDADGFWVVDPPSADEHFQSPALLSSGGPDEYGYTWDGTVPFAWIDATSGTDTGMSGSKTAVNVLLPFTFPYYENTYDEVWIASSGYLSFAEASFWASFSDIPSLPPPNDVIAPYWTPIDLDVSGPSGRVYYSSGGESPNRYFAVEWYQVTSSNETYTFEVILHENGDIVFQYETMAYIGTYYCGSAGIEDATGEDGLNYVPFCVKVTLTPRAVRFTRPNPAARPKITPQAQDRFSSSGETTSFQLTIANLGELGPDTFDLTESSSWTVSYFEQDGVTPLTDTDSDGVVDTDDVAQGASVIVTVKIQPPPLTGIGGNALTTITATSSLDTNQLDTASLQTAVPARFAQIYADNADGAMSLFLVDPNTRDDDKVTADGANGYGMSIAETPGFVYAWATSRCLAGPCSTWVYEIKYTLLDEMGNTVRAVTKLVDHSGASMTTEDYPVAVAVAPDGTIGMLWSRTLRHTNDSQVNVNIYFALLDASGDLSYGPVNLTNNTAWGVAGDVDVPFFYSPRIEATGDSRFILAWDRWHDDVSGIVIDIYYAVRMSDGVAVKEVTKLTSSIPGDTGHYEPVLAPLSGNRVFLSWSSYLDYYDVYYIVMDSAGNLIKSPTNLSEDNLLVDFGNYDAVELAGGNILAAWQSYSCFQGESFSRIRYALLDSSYTRMGEPSCLDGSSSGDSNASVTADAFGHGIITWLGDNDSRLYYALIDSSGTILTEPMIIQSSAQPYWDEGVLRTGHGGYGNTTFRQDLEQVYLPFILN
jgi:hypothetical protein